MLGAINVLVRRSVKRSAAKLEEQLAAAEAGEPTQATGGTRLILDPESARLHAALGQFLERQRRLQRDLASRLEHTDQLASLGQLAAGLAHEIKNPLAGIQGALEILREEDPEDRTARLYDEMLAEFERVNTTLQLLLESARPSPPRLVPADPESLVKDAVYLLRPGLSRRKVSLRYEVAADIGEILIDPGKVRQVLINLIQNAAEAMDGDGEIVVRAGPFPEGRGGLILAVEDDGPGISPEIQAKVFEPFFTTKFAGTGLGLAISKRLVEQHGGTLEVDSLRGKGTTFYVLLPAGSDAAGLPGQVEAEG
jgi:signal transduction histidine kinase